MAIKKIDSIFNDTLDAITNVLAAHDVFHESMSLTEGKQSFKEAFMSHILNGETEPFSITYHNKSVRFIIPFFIENGIVTLVEIQVYDRPIKNLKTTRMTLAVELSNVVSG